MLRDAFNYSNNHILRLKISIGSDKISSDYQETIGESPQIISNNRKKKRNQIYDAPSDISVTSGADLFSNAPITEQLKRKKKARPRFKALYSLAHL